MVAVDFPHLAGAFAAAFVAGAINSVAGGGTMISFPALMALGLPPVMANATNTVGIWPGSIGSVWGFRRELTRVHRRMLWLLAPAALGGVIGAILLKDTPAGVFEKLVPALLLFATVLFIVQAPIQKRLRSVEAAHEAGGKWLVWALAAQSLVSVYGGYFGAGMSIMNLSILGVIGMTDILEMNAMTSLVSVAINGTAGILFAASGMVSWPYALAMTGGSLIGGYGAAGIARRIGKTAVRSFVIFMGLAIAAAMTWRLLRP